MISVGPLDQVVGIQDDNDRPVVIRTGISPSDLSGKTWKVISAGKCEQPSLNLLNSVVASAIIRPPPSENEPKSQVTEGSSNANFKKTASEFGDRVAKNMATSLATGAVAATVGRIPIAGPIVTSVSSQIVREELSKVRLVEAEEEAKEAKEAEETKEAKEAKIDESMYQSALENPENIRETSIESDVQSTNSSDNTTIFDREDHYGDELDDDHAGPQWVWLTMGACKLDPSHLPGSWFVETISSQQSLSGEAWRMNILQV